MKLLNDSIITSKILKLNIPYVDMQLINKVNISLGLKLGEKNINGIDNLILKDFENVKQIMISILDNHNKEPINYQQWIFQNKNILVEWVKSFKNHPTHTLKYLNLLLPPRFFVYKKLLTSSKISDNTYNMWTIFCKGA